IYAVGPQNEAGAKGLDHVAIGIQLHHGIEIGAGAGVGATAVADPDALAIDVDVDRTDGTPRTSRRRITPVAHGFVGVGQVVDGGDICMLGRSGVALSQRQYWQRRQHAGYQHGAEESLVHYAPLFDELVLTTSQNTRRWIHVFMSLEVCRT